MLTARSSGTRSRVARPFLQRVAIDRDRLLQPPRAGFALPDRFVPADPIDVGYDLVDLVLMPALAAFRRPEKQVGGSRWWSFGRGDGTLRAR